MARRGKDFLPSDYYPLVRKRNGKTRELLITDLDLVKVIEDYLDELILSSKKLQAYDSRIFFQTKKGIGSTVALEKHSGMTLRW